MAEGYRMMSFCRQNKLMSLIQLADTVQRLHEVDFQVFEITRRRRRHHKIDTHQDIFHFYDISAHDIRGIIHDLEQLPTERNRLILGSVTVMKDIMEEEIRKSGRPLKYILKRSRRVRNLDVLNERVTISLANIIENFLSIQEQCVPFS